MVKWEERLMIVCRAVEDTTGERLGQAIRTGGRGERGTALPDLLQPGADQRETPREKRPTRGPTGRGARVENRPAREIGGLETLRLLRHHQQSPAPGGRGRGRETRGGGRGGRPGRWRTDTNQRRDLTETGGRGRGSGRRRRRGRG